MVACAMAAPADDLMGNLPDAPAFKTNTYSGYLTASETKSLHYAFAESMDSPSTDPIIIWFNGGPGCSSMLGMMQELGPIVVDDGEDYFSTNPHPWNERANVLFQIIQQSMLDDWNTQGCEAYFHNVRPATETPECETMAKRMMDLSGELNWYDLYRKNYDLPTSTDRVGKTVIAGEERTFKLGMTMAEYTPFASHILDSPSAHVSNGDFLT